jgi:hypothetical protein
MNGWVADGRLEGERAETEAKRIERLSQWSGAPP